MDKFLKTAGVFSLMAAAALSRGADLRTQQADTPIGASMQISVGYSNPSERKLNAFAAAYIKVAEIYNNHVAQVSAARTSEQAYQAHHAINYQMAQAIQEEGLSPAEYISLVRSINENPALGRRVAHKIRMLQ